MNAVVHMDNGSHRTSPHPNLAQPVLATGQTKTVTTAGTNYTATVVSGGRYSATVWVPNETTNGAAAGTVAFFGVTGTTATAANIEWACGNMQTVEIDIPIGTTTLNIGATVSGTIVYLREIYK